MAILHINPTRMELKRMKSRLKTAVRGHKLLKDKTDEMIRKFIAFARKNQKLRMEVEKNLGDALSDFVLAKAVTSSEIMEEALLVPSRTVELDCKKRSVMNVMVPEISMKTSASESMYGYSFLTTTAGLDYSVRTLDGLTENLLRLAEVEKTCNMLADEIEKNKRRVNALEHIMIPNIKETIKYITMKLDENERGALIRLMKVKEMIADR